MNLPEVRSAGMRSGAGISLRDGDKHKDDPCNKEDFLPNSQLEPKLTGKMKSSTFRCHSVLTFPLRSRLWIKRGINCYEKMKPKLTVVRDEMKTLQLNCMLAKKGSQSNSQSSLQSEKQDREPVTNTYTPNTMVMTLKES